MFIVLFIIHTFKKLVKRGVLMSYSIFFDESNKLDNEKTYSY
ncbi:hypothetical protein SD78_3114 [Bacillus badius]|nr:hypothetical protein SD78_3114 [Bacillus badius]